jgi:integrase
VRSIDVRRAKVDEIDLKERVLVIPDRSKNKKREPIPHRVPVTDAAIEVLNRMQTYREMLSGAVKESKYLFPTPDVEAAFSVNLQTLSGYMTRMLTGARLPACLWWK